MACSYSTPREPIGLHINFNTHRQQLCPIVLAAGALVNSPASPSKGRTALQAAAEGGYMDIIEILLAAGASINAAACDFYGRTALQAAAECGYIAIVEVLLTAGARVNVRNTAGLLLGGS